MGRRVVAAASLALAVGLGVSGLVSPTWSSFSKTTTNPGNSFASAPDFRAPTASGSVVLKSQGGTPGYIKQGAAYTVLASVTDTGNPASGVSSVTGNVSAVTAGQTAAALAAGSFSAGGTSYNRGSASLTAGASLTEGTKTYSLTSTDVAGNVGTQSTFSVVVDNTAPTASDVQTTNVSGGTVGQPQAGDTVVFTFSEPMEPGSILSGWTGASTNVVVRIADGGGLLGLGNDALTIRNSAGSAQLPFGSVDLGRADYRSTFLGLGGDINFTSSPMVMSGSQVTVTLGTRDDPATNTAGGTSTMTWGPAATPYDRAANVMTTGSATETGGADKEF
ncbi:MAG: large repetitive protein [Miltoncostaeaceae bacterium]|nr:large repetitive protein [Miltoncostaeaceae bacterium]